ncbi:hypothetical protein WME76_13465 [Sorangium sp. So ce119]
MSRLERDLAPDPGVAIAAPAVAAILLWSARTHAPGGLARAGKP